MSQNPTWTEPPWSGWIETTGDALLILEAARRGLIPRVTRRLVDSERKMITSGSVFVFDEDESGIKRWTDGFFWSPSRILGNFLLYRETDKKGASNRGRGSDPDANDHPQYNIDGVRLEGQTLSRPKSETGLAGVNKQRERTLMGSLTNSYKFKPDGLMKKTFSLTIGGVSQHLISYYRIEDVENGRLRPPSSLPELASLDISPEYLDKTHFRNPPKVEIGADGRPRYRGEADDIENSPSLTAPLSTGLPLLSDSARPPASAATADSPSSSANRRDRRFNPLSITPSAPKRIRKPTKSSPTETSPSTPLPPPDTPTSASATSTAFPDPPPPAAPSSSPQGYPPAAHAYFPPYPQPPHPHMYASSPYPPAAPQSQYTYPYDQARTAPPPPPHSQPYYPSYSTHPPPPPAGFNSWHPHSQPHTHPHSHAHSQGHYQGYPQHLHAPDTGKHDTGPGERKS